MLLPLPIAGSYRFGLSAFYLSIDMGGFSLG
jgi:hypothetical protein